jgi:cell division protein FtsL
VKVTVSMTPVVKPDLGSRRGAGVWAFVLALCTVGALAHVAVRMHGIQIAYALGRERRINAELEEQRRRLNIEIGMLKDPDRVIGIAREKLGMGPPAPENVVRLDSGGLTRPPAAAVRPASGTRK